MNDALNNPEKVYYTKTPSVCVFLLKDTPTAMLILQYVLVRQGVAKGWKFRIQDLANQLNMTKKTAKRNLKPLLALNLLTLKGVVGQQYYEFNKATYKKLLHTNPFSKDDPSPIIGPSRGPKMTPRPSPIMTPGPSPKMTPRRGVKMGPLHTKDLDIKEIDTKEEEKGAVRELSPLGGDTSQLSKTAAVSINTSSISEASASNNSVLPESPGDFSLARLSEG